MKSKFDVWLIIIVYFIFLVFITLLIFHIGNWLVFPFSHRIDFIYIPYVWFYSVLFIFLFTLSLVSERSFLIFLLVFFILSSGCILWYWNQIFSMPAWFFSNLDTIRLTFFLSIDHIWTEDDFIYECDRVFSYAEYKTNNSFRYDREKNIPLVIADMLKRGITAKWELRFYMFNLITTSPPYPYIGEFKDFNNLFTHHPEPDFWLHLDNYVFRNFFI